MCRCRIDVLEKIERHEISRGVPRVAYIEIALKTVENTREGG